MSGRSVELLRMAEASLSPMVARELAVDRATGPWGKNFPFQVHLESVERAARDAARKLVWC